MPNEKLSKRELEVFHGAMLGESAGLSAKRLFISVTTVRTHRRDIVKKLGAKNMANAAYITLVLRGEKKDFTISLPLWLRYILETTPDKELLDMNDLKTVGGFYNFAHDYQVALDAQRQLTEARSRLDVIEMREQTVKDIHKWLQKHCKGYHRGNHGGEYGYFGIFRSEMDALERGEKPGGRVPESEED